MVYGIAAPPKEVKGYFGTWLTLILDWSLLQFLLAEKCDDLLVFHSLVKVLINWTDDILQYYSNVAYNTVPYIIQFKCC